VTPTISIARVDPRAPEVRLLLDASDIHMALFYPSESNHMLDVQKLMQPEALGLYRALGYVERRPFGDYKSDPLSVFMEKAL
jgi:hypothetical protein